MKFSKILCISAACAVIAPAIAQANSSEIQMGPRPYYLIDALEKGPLKEKLESCAQGPFKRTKFSIGHRGAPLQFPEHTRESYMAAYRMGAGILECDVTFTKDKELVCRHSQCDLHTTTDILAKPDLAAKCTEPFTLADPAKGTKANAKCCTSDITLAEFRTLNGKMDAANSAGTTVEDYMNGTANWRTDLYSTTGTLMTHKESIALFKELGVGFTPELKSPSVKMPFAGDFTQEAYAQKMIDEYKDAGIDPSEVYAQSFNLADVKYWIKNDPAFGTQAVYLDDRYDIKEFDFRMPKTWSPSMEELVEKGVKIIAPPMWMLVDLDDKGNIIASAYAKAAKKAGLQIITWSLERSGPLASGGGWYYQSIKDAVTTDGAMMKLVDVLAQEVGVIALFSDWPATTTYYASCMDLK